MRVALLVVLLASCAGTRTHEVARDEAARSPSAVVERITFDEEGTVGCGWSGGGGGRGAIGSPSWRESRFVPTHTTWYRCELRRGAVRAEVPCGAGPVQLREDVAGQRFAVNGGSGWQLFAGGAVSALIEHPAGDVAQPAAFDWTGAPSVGAMLERAYAEAAQHESDGGTRLDASVHVLAELRALNETTWPDRLVSLRKYDVGWNVCRGDTAWTSAVRALPDPARVIDPLWRAGVTAQLLDLLTPAELFARAGEPKRFMSTHPDDVAAEVLDAWSLQEAPNAGAYACGLLARDLAPALRAAALLAVGRAGLTCPAVRRHVRGVDCRGLRDAEGELESRDAAAESVKAQAHVALCDPALGALLAARVQPAPLDVEAMCGAGDD